MAAPMTATQLVTALKEEGLVVEHVGDWRTHNRNHKGPWGPVHGVMIHHTVTSGETKTVRLCQHGYPGLPGPLCHGVIAKSGTIHLVGYGRTNHAGLGDDDVLEAVVGERALPPDNESNTDGNRYFYGFECENLGDGEDPWPEAQLDSIERACAAICRHHDWEPGAAIGHLEWQPGKIDPRGFSMDTMRERIGTRLDNQTKPPVKPKPRPPFPGRAAFGPGKNNVHIKRLGEQLVRKGYARHYRLGPSRTWGEADRRNVQAFQRAHPQLRADADGYPGPLTWHLLWS
ncbi:peptidoglycan-binding protein [Streptomyces chryseus]